MLRVNKERFFEDLDSLAKIGRTLDEGVTRLALSETDLEARGWFKARAEEAGLKFHQDGAGNISAILPAKNPRAKTLLAGSHLDSVPNGGRFDGVLGVVSALEALRTIKEADLDLEFHLEAISFTDEEGTWLGLLGSRAFAGLLTSKDLKLERGVAKAFDQALSQAGFSSETLLSTGRDPTQYAGFIEAHIEQGSRLESAKLSIGLVTNIVGVRWYWLRFTGESAHAGTQPMAQRSDALWGACAFIDSAKDLVQNRLSPGVSNFGQLHVKPGVFNIVPAEVELAMEIRHTATESLDEMEQALFKLAEECAKTYHLTVERRQVNEISPAHMDEHMIQTIEHATNQLELKHTRLVSFAFHDTQSMSAIMPSVLYFVPSVNGISHNPKEFTNSEDMKNCANVMLHAILAFQ